MARSILICPAKQRCCGRLAGGLESFDHFSVFCFLLTQKEWCTSGWKFRLISPWRNSTSELWGWDILLGNIIVSIKQSIHTPVLSLLLSLPYTHGRKVCCQLSLVSWSVLCPVYFLQACSPSSGAAVTRYQPRDGELQGSSLTAVAPSEL